METKWEWEIHGGLAGSYHSLIHKLLFDTYLATNLEEWIPAMTHIIYL